jgi:MFS family permease
VGATVGAPVQRATTARPPLVCRWKLPCERVAQPQPSPGDHQAKLLAGSKERGGWSERDVDRDDLTWPKWLALVWLPGLLIIGLGIGLTYPVLSAAAVSSLQHERFAVGSAVNQTARQVGGACGIALLVVILGTPRGLSDALNHFHELWWYAAAMATLSGLACVFIRPERRNVALRADARAAATNAPALPVSDGLVGVGASPASNG